MRGGRRVEPSCPACPAALTSCGPEGCRARTSKRRLGARFRSAHAARRRERAAGAGHARLPLRAARRRAAWRANSHGGRSCARFRRADIGRKREARPVALWRSAGGGGESVRLSAPAGRIGRAGDRSRANSHERTWRGDQRPASAGRCAAVVTAFSSRLGSTYSAVR